MPHLTRTVEMGLVGFSVVMFVGSIALVPWIIRRLPPDHFVRPPHESSLLQKIARNTIGVVLVALGIAMLVLPGQGVLAILFGVSIMDLKVKHTIVRRLLCQEKIQEVVQRIRSSSGKAPLVFPREPITG